jgi:alkylhydroperoxidase family enzyme
MARLEPLSPDAWSEPVREILGGTLGPVSELEGRPAQNSGPLNILRVIAHHPTLLGPFLGFASALATRGVLSRRVSELLALRAAWNCRSAFEWGHHVHYARAAGMSEAEIARLALGPEAPGWSAEDRTLLHAADELHRAQRISDATWQQLAARFDEAQLLEIPFIVGQYTMLSMVANATDVPLEPGLPELPGINSEGASG